MTGPPSTLRVLPAADAHPSEPPGQFGPDTAYSTGVWLPLLGPASYLAWHYLARQLTQWPGGLTTSVHRLAVDLGLASSHEDAVVGGALHRLERFGIIRPVTDALLVLRVELPAASATQLDLLDRSIQIRHQHLRCTPVSAAGRPRSTQHRSARPCRPSSSFTPVRP